MTLDIHCIPKYIRSDNGSEFVANHLASKWLISCLTILERAGTVKAPTERRVIIYSMAKSSMECEKLKLS